MGKTIPVSSGGDVISSCKRRKSGALSPLKPNGKTNQSRKTASSMLTEQLDRTESMPCPGAEEEREQTVRKKINIVPWGAKPKGQGNT